MPLLPFACRAERCYKRGMAKLIGPSADALARLHTAEAIGALVHVIRDPLSKGSERVAAANSLLDRGHGKATQAIIAVPARRAVAARLAAMSDDALVAVVAKRREGGLSQNGGPNREGRAGIPLLTSQAHSGESTAHSEKSPLQGMTGTPQDDMPEDRTTKLVGKPDPLLSRMVGTGGPLPFGLEEADDGEYGVRGVTPNRGTQKQMAGGDPLRKNALETATSKPQPLAVSADDYEPIDDDDPLA